jgi:amino acid adenylation domain-containing protein
VSTDLERKSPTTSKLANFTVRLVPSISTEEKRVSISIAWAFAMSVLYSRPHVSIGYFGATSSDSTLGNNFRTPLTTSLLGQGWRAVLAKFMGSSVGEEPSNQGPSALSVQTTVIRELAQDTAVSPGFPKLLQRRTYYPYETALEWRADESEFRFQCHWDSTIFTEVKIRGVIDSFRCELQSMHRLQQDVTQISPPSDGKQTTSPLDSPSESALSTPCTEISEVTDTAEQGKSDDISAHDKEVMLELNSRDIPVATRTISQLVSDSYSHQPEAIAVASWDRDLSYKALENLSQALAAHLRHNIGTQPVPILTVFGKSALGVVVLLAVIRSGHYYVPMDPSHPLARKKTVFEQARCRMVLTSAESEQTCMGLESPSTLAITWDFLERLSCSNDGSADASSIDGIGVVLFTSGSTGKPKGAVLSHRAISTSLMDHGAYLGLDSSSRMLSFASYAFDAHLWDTWTCLIYRGTVCIPNDSERTNDLQGYINRAQVSVGMLMSAALEYLEPDGMPFLKKLGVGGDAVTKSHLLPWADSKTQVFEAYGPTECSVFSSLNTQLSSEDPSDIGKPVGGRIWITDPENVDRLLPCGTEGELVITGHHIAEGYLHDIEKTEAAFVTPAWPDWVPGPRRAYRTGDLAVLDTSGTLRIRGRMDRQIKLNGLRIERGELEHHIASCDLHASLPTVEKVELATGKHQLVCFFVPSGISAPFCAILPPNEALAKIEDTVRERLSREVPASWMPNVFVFLTQMPLNTSDKIDRQHLLRLFKDSAAPPPAPQSSPTPQAKSSSQRPNETISGAAADTKDILRRAWSQVLGIDASQITDNANFLRLGGSSMDAIKLVANLRKQSVDINTTQVLTHPILSDQASLHNQKKESSIQPEQERVRTPEPFELL